MGERRNVDRLAEILAVIAETRPWLGSIHEPLAQALAAQGVLAIDALGDTETRQAVEAGMLDDYDGEDNFAGQSFAFPDRTRAALRRLATGEPKR